MNIDDFRARLRINKRRLDEELEDQAELLEKIGRETARAAFAEAKAKVRLEGTEARLTREAVEGDAKLALNRAVLIAQEKREYREAKEDHLQAKKTLAEWEALEKAWYNRGFDLKALVELYSAQYFTQSEVSSGSRIDQPGLRASIREASTKAGDFIERQQRSASRRTRLQDEP